jgi:hypothetical protein
MIDILSKLKYFLCKNRSTIFLIIGVQKAGTTTLYDMLNGQNSFCGSRDKETGFFTNDVFYNQGRDWYTKQFEQCSSDSIKFEATPFYLYHPDAPKRIFTFNSRMKFIVILREPASRCYSAWNMFRQFREASPDKVYEQFVQYSNPTIRDAISNLLFKVNYPTFKQAVEDDIERYLSKSSEIEPSFVRRGIYFDQIDNYLQYFSLEQFLFLEQRELNLPIKLAKKISDFFNIKIDLSVIKHPILSNVGEYLKYDSEVEETLTMLRDFYKPHNEKLFNQIGIHFDWNDGVGLN